MDISLIRENKTSIVPIQKKKKQTLNVVLHQIASQKHSSQAKLANMSNSWEISVFSIRIIRGKR